MILHEREHFDLREVKELIHRLVEEDLFLVVQLDVLSVKTACQILVQEVFREQEFYLDLRQHKVATGESMWYLLATFYSFRVSCR